MAGSITVTLTKKQVVHDAPDARGIIECKIDWVTQAAGAGEGTLTSAAIVSTADYLKYLAGRECMFAVTDPGTVAPTAAYDITITDEYGTDVFGGELTNRDAATSEQAIPIFGTHKTSRICLGPWAFNLSGNAVPSALGSCILYFR